MKTVSDSMIAVAAGVCYRSGGAGCEVLITRRPDRTVLPGYWEFPGGKVHVDEPLDCAVVREFREEVALHVQPERLVHVVDHAYDHGHIRLHLFICRYLGGQVQHLAVSEHRWVNPGSLTDYRFPPANQKIIGQLIGLLGEFGRIRFRTAPVVV